MAVRPAGESWATAGHAQSVASVSWASCPDRAQIPTCLPRFSAENIHPTIESDVCWCARDVYVDAKNTAAAARGVGCMIGAVVRPLATEHRPVCVSSACSGTCSAQGARCRCLRRFARDGVRRPERSGGRRQPRWRRARTAARARWWCSLPRLPAVPELDELVDVGAAADGEDRLGGHHVGQHSTAAHIDGPRFTVTWSTRYSCETPMPR